MKISAVTELPFLVCVHFLGGSAFVYFQRLHNRAALDHGGIRSKVAHVLAVLEVNVTGLAPGHAPRVAHNPEEAKKEQGK